MNTLCPHNSIPSTYPTKMHIELHLKTSVRRQHYSLQPQPGDYANNHQQQNRLLQTQQHTLGNEGAETTKNNMGESQRGMKGWKKTGTRVHAIKRGRDELQWCVATKKVIPWETRLVLPRRGHQGVSAVLIIPNFLIWVLQITCVNSFCENSSCCTLRIFSLFIYLQYFHKTFINTIVL